MRCSNCDTDNREGRRFCAECGVALVISCPACGSVERARGAVLRRVRHRAERPGRPARPPPPISERRVTSILFADLVGFTTLSEQRDPEDVRELLARYFDTASGIVARYGGTLEKFIGDAVVAVWGTPIALEDDAERAVRAALDLVSAVAQLGDDTNSGAAAAGAVSTGETAVTIGALGQGMVAGDVVNTTARMQSAARAGVSADRRGHPAVDRGGHRELPAGSFTLKGKAEPVELWTALRVVAGRGGEGRSLGSNHPSSAATASFGWSRRPRWQPPRRVARSWSRSSASPGSARAGWRGSSRSTATASCERSGGTRGAASATATASRSGRWPRWCACAPGSRRTSRSRAWPPSSRRRWRSSCPTPRSATGSSRALGNLLGLEEAGEGDRGRLFSGWRLFFERMADSGPTVLVFEDIQWADQALLDFIEYLMEWSRDHPLLVVTLARPELFDRRAGWGVGSRAFTSLTLEPLAPETMRDLVDGMAPGLPDSLVQQIVDRAEGVPLYAVETVRMLLDRGLLERRDGQMVVIGEVEALEIPETLHALTAARLDALGESERKLVQDAAVLGKTFQIEGLAAVSGLGATQLEPLLEALRRKEIFSVTEDPRSPEQGQYGFVQELLRTVAYETLGRRDRKARHLATAVYLESLPAGDELIEVIAAHQLDAYRAMPDDGEDVRDIARESLLRAAQRAASLAAQAEAMRLVLQAVELTDSDRDRAELQQRAAQLALSAGLVEQCEALAGEAIALLEADGDVRAAASPHVVRAEARFLLQRPDEAAAEMEDAYAVMCTEPPDAELAVLAAQLGRMRMFITGAEPALEPIERAIEIAESLQSAAAALQRAQHQGNHPERTPTQKRPAACSRAPSGSPWKTTSPRPDARLLQPVIRLRLLGPSLR